MSRRSVFLLLAVILVIALASPLWFPYLGQYLVATDSPAPADAAIVLAGDQSGNRILKGAELGQARLVPVVYVSGPGDMYGRNEAEFEIEYAVRKGFDPAIFRPVPHAELSTYTEAKAILPVLRQAGVRKLLLVTSEFHTRRAGAIWHHLAPEMEIRVIGAPFMGFDPAHWWRQREWRKIVFFEWAKTFGEFAGM